jgi:peptidyl-prolyl cis-trans isomerase D
MKMVKKTAKITKNNAFMKKFKSLFTNIIFKLFIGFLILSFAFFGVSSFILGDSGSWVAKIDGKKISVATLQKNLEFEKNLILRSAPNNENALNYVNSQQFVLNVLKKLISQNVMKEIGEQYGVNGDRRLILEAVAQDPSFVKEGKFDHEKFRNFLRQNGLDEKTYVEFVQNEIVNAMVVNSISLTSPIDEQIVREIAEIKEEKRIADLVMISQKNVKSIKSPSDADLKSVYEQNKAEFVVPEKRNVEYISFNKNDIAKKIKVGQKELESYYESHKQEYRQEENRDFYHILMSEKSKAEDFLKRLNDSKNKAQTFIQEGKKLGKNVVISSAFKKDTLEQIANKAFSLKKGENSGVIASELGYHVVLVKDIKKADYTPFSKLKKEIEAQILATKLEKEISSLDNILIASNSLQKLAKEYGLAVKKVTIESDSDKIKLENFVKNAFLARQNQASSVYISGNSYYAFKVEKIISQKQKSFDEVKNQISKIYLKDAKSKALKELAKEIFVQIEKNPQNLRKIANEFGLKFIYNKEFGRTQMIEIQGKKIPFSDNFLQDLFGVKINQATSFHQDSDGFKIAVLKKIKKAKIDDKELAEYKKQMANIYRSEILEEFNNYIQDKLKIEVNQKFLESLKQE